MDFTINEINKLDNSVPYNEGISFKPIIFSHSIIILSPEEDIVKSLAAAHQISIYATMVKRKYIKGNIPEPFNKLIFAVKDKETWEKLKEITENIQMFIDGVCNTIGWESVSTKNLPTPIPDLSDTMYVIALYDKERKLMPVNDDGQIVYVKKPVKVEIAKNNDILFDYEEKSIISSFFDEHKSELSDVLNMISEDINNEHERRDIK